MIAAADWFVCSCRPTLCITMITRVIIRAGLPTELVLRMDENVSKLVNAVSACDRILNTPIPISYTRHTSRFLVSLASCLAHECVSQAFYLVLGSSCLSQMVWLACLPFSLWQYCGWAMVPIAGAISFVLLGIEEIGVYIEEPFSLLPLESLCEKLVDSIKGMRLCACGGLHGTVA